MDQSGSKIQATIKKTLMYKFEKAVVEGSVYCIGGFVLVDNAGEYKTTLHSYKISFMYKTEIIPAKEVFVDVFPYTFSSIAEIILPGFDNSTLVDVIGILTGVGVEREIVTHGKKSKMNIIEIESAGLTIECALFGAYVDELTNFLTGSEVNHPVVIVQFVKVKTFQGNVSLQNVHGATKIIFDPDLPMSNVLKTSFVEQCQGGTRSISQLTDSRSGSAEEEFLDMSARKTIDELKDMKRV